MKTVYGELIREQREKAGLAIDQLADRCLIKKDYLKLAEEGEPVLSRTDLVIICNVLDISSVALMEGRIVRKPDARELEDLIERLSQKADELQESIREMKEAAASLTIMTQAKALEIKGAVKDQDEMPEKDAEAVKPEPDESPEQEPEKPDRDAPAKKAEPSEEKKEPVPAYKKPAPQVPRL